MAEAAVPELPSSGGGGAGTPSGTVPVLVCSSVLAPPRSVPQDAGYELLIQKFLSLYGVRREFGVQLFAEEWGQYVDLPEGFAVSERCEVRLVQLRTQVDPAGRPRAPLRSPSSGVPVPAALLRCPALPGALSASPGRKGRASFASFGDGPENVPVRR